MKAKITIDFQITGDISNQLCSFQINPDGDPDPIPDDINIMMAHACLHAANQLLLRDAEERQWPDHKIPTLMKYMVDQLDKAAYVTQIAASNPVVKA